MPQDLGGQDVAHGEVSQVTLQDYFDASEGGKPRLDSIASATDASVRAKTPASDTSATPKPVGILKHTESTNVMKLDESLFDNPRELHEARRQLVREDLMKKAGNALMAFAAINLNGSGRICSQEFADGVARLGVPWQQLTGLRRPRDLFKLFDADRDGIISLFELFPAERNKKRDDSGITTPEFWKTWVKHNRNLTDKACPGPKWQPGSPEEELSLLFGSLEKNKEAVAKRGWMKTTMRRMKSRGKTDARCREMVALHLPRGTGPKDRQDVPTFSEAEVKMCKRGYSDEVLEPQRTIQKALYDLRESRRVLQTSRQKLWTVAMEPIIRHQQQEERKAALGSFNLLGHGGGQDQKKKEEEEEKKKHPDVNAEISEGMHQAYHESVPHEQESFNSLSKRTGMDVDLIEDVFRIWMKYADKSELITKRNYVRLLEELCPKRTLVESDLTAWWDQIHRISVTGSNEEASKKGANVADSRKTPASFDCFIIWFSSSEARTV